jgi:small subunit ribosomal protein S19e
MTTVYDIPADQFIRKVAVELKQRPEVKPPAWAAFAKTGVHKEMPPEDPDWWFVRAAAVLRRVYVDGPVGVQRMRSFYGGAKNRGSKPNALRRGSGSVLRKSLQQLEAAGLIVHEKTGRRVSPAGRAFLDGLAHAMKTAAPAAPKPETKPAAKAEAKAPAKGEGKAAKAEKKAEAKPAAKAPKAEKKAGSREEAKEPKAPKSAPRSRQ